MNNKVIIAHRGASAYAPENTFAAFRKAVELRANMIEFDVMLSLDNEAFVFHDDCLQRTTNGYGMFNRVTSDYIASLDAGSWFSPKFKNEKVPLLSQVLHWLASVEILANIEIKPLLGKTEITTTVILSLINQFWPRNKPLPLISSFDWQALVLLRSLAPEMPIGLLMDEWQEQGMTLASEIGCQSIHLNKEIANKERIKKILSKGFTLYVYTVNYKFQARRFFSSGVHGIFSDYPDLIS